MCWDNAAAESFFAALKNDTYYRQHWATRARARFAVAKYIKVFYNRRRLHSSLGYRTPFEALTDHRPAAAAGRCLNATEETARWDARRALWPGTASCFKSGPDRLNEYKARHRAVWPDMLAALRMSGWHNYSIFTRDDGLLVGYVEADDLAAAQAAMAATEVNALWQAEMSDYFVGLAGRGPDESFQLPDEIFHLDERTH